MFLRSAKPSSQPSGKETGQEPETPCRASDLILGGIESGLLQPVPFGAHHIDGRTGMRSHGVLGLGSDPERKIRSQPSVIIPFWLPTSSEKVRGC
jgi:hypothetical protein